ncbi:MAG: MFS transporter [Bacteroidales bacterium]|nr:MFS transporter [Bacteroidales bacterium]
MLTSLKSYYQKLPPAPQLQLPEEELRRKTRRLQLETFFAAVVGHSLYYVCRTTLNVVKTPIVDANLLNDAQLGIVGSAMLFAYAAGKFINSFITDYSNIKRFMATGLVLSVIANVIVGALGFSVSGAGLGVSAFFLTFTVLWVMNGWGQSMGTAPPIVSLSRWFSQKERGTFYGFFSAGHGIGEFLSFIIIGSVVGYIGWQQGFFAAALCGVIGIFVIVKYLHDSPESMGLPPIGVTKQKSVKAAQKMALTNRNVWFVAIASGLMYVSRYAINGWGVRYLEIVKGYELQEATWVIGLNAMAVIFGAMSAGWLSDRLFAGRRNVPALMFGVLNTIALACFLTSGDALWINIVAMLIFGLSIGGLICFLGGLMAIDYAPRMASGAAVGMVGLVSYIFAGVQDVITGRLIEAHHTVVDGVDYYNFHAVSIFWISASALSFLVALLVWKAKPSD